jgi:hypothetical protein
MFNDKKLRNTFGLAVITVVLPMSYWMILMRFSDLRNFVFGIEIGLSLITFFTSIYTLIVFIKTYLRKLGKPLIIAFGILLSFIGIIIGPYFILLSIVAIDHFI